MGAALLLLSKRPEVIEAFTRPDPGRPEVLVKSPDGVKPEDAASHPLVILDLGALPEAVRFGRKLREKSATVEFVPIVADEREGVEALRGGALEFLVWPPADVAALWPLLGGCLARLGPLVPAEEPETLGDYRIVRRLGAGGMAEVFLASGADGQPLVLKCLLPNVADDPSVVEMFLHEARLSAQLSHPNIVRVFDAGKADDRLYIAMEHVAGHDLDRIGRAADWRIPAPLACFVAAEVCAGLAYAHSRSDAGKPLQIVHRDVNPPNILVSEAGAVKLTDFGIAKTTQRHRETTAGVLKGKIDYLSPEQLDGQPVDHRSDLFSLGVVLHLMLSSVHPFRAATPLQTLMRLRNVECEAPSALNSEAPRELDAIVMRALARRRDKRYGSASEMEGDLRAFLAKRPGDAAALAAFASGALAGAMPRDAHRAAESGPGTARVLPPGVLPRSNEVTLLKVMKREEQTRTATPLGPVERTAVSPRVSANPTAWRPPPAADRTAVSPVKRARDPDTDTSESPAKRDAFDGVSGFTEAAAPPPRAPARTNVSGPKPAAPSPRGCRGRAGASAALLLLAVFAGLDAVLPQQAVDGLPVQAGGARGLGDVHVVAPEQVEQVLALEPVVRDLVGDRGVDDAACAGPAVADRSERDGRGVDLVGVLERDRLLDHVP